MKVKSFVGLMKSCKWVNAVITENRSTFILKRDTITIDYKKVRENRRLLESYQYYHLRKIIFSDFENHVDELLAVLNSLNGTVLVTEVELINTVAIKELFLYLRPNVLTVKVRSSSSHSHCPIATVTRDEIPGHLERINVDLDGPSTVELLEKVISHFVGKSRKLIIRMSLQTMEYDALYDQLKFCMTSLGTYSTSQQVFFEWNKSTKDLKKEPTIVAFFRSKAKCPNSNSLQGNHDPDLKFLQGSDCPWLISFYKKDPGFVITLLKDKREGFAYQLTTVGMSYCSTRHDLHGFTFNFYFKFPDYDYRSQEHMENKIKEHFSSIGMGDDDDYEPFETIEKQEFKLRPKQLEASELQLILDWKQRKPPLQLPWKLPVAEQEEQLLKLLCEAVDIQEQWITFLRKGKYIFEEIPHNCVLEILKRMDTKAFVKALRTCKEIKKFIDYGQPTVIKYVQRQFFISPGNIEDGMDQWVASELECRSRFRFMRIEFSNFQHKIQILQAVVSQLADRNIFCDTLVLFNTVLTEKMMKLRPKYINFCDLYYKTPQNYPEHVIKVHVDITEKGRLISVAEDLAGKHFEVEVELRKILWSSEIEEINPLFMEAIRCCIEKMKSRRNSGRCLFNWCAGSYSTKNIKQEVILQGKDCFSYIKSTEDGQTFIFVEKAAEGVVAGVFSDCVKKFLWQFITTMEDFEKLFVDGTRKNDRILGPEDEIAFAKIRSYFPTATDLHNRPVG